MGATESSREVFWGLIRKIAGSKPLESVKAWRSVLKSAVPPRDAGAFEAELSKVFMSAVNREFFDAFYLYTNHVDPDFFASFIAALILNGREAFEECVANPEQLVALGLPNDMYFEAEGFVPAASSVLRSMGAKPTWDLDACTSLAEATLAHIQAIDLTGHSASRARQPAFESEEEYGLWLRSQIFFKQLAERWPELARAGQD